MQTTKATTEATTLTGNAEFYFHPFLLQGSGIGNDEHILPSGHDHSRNRLNSLKHYDVVFQ